jgi:hypothetical protein
MADLFYSKHVSTKSDPIVLTRKFQCFRVSQAFFPMILILRNSTIDTLITSPYVSLQQQPSEQLTIRRQPVRLNFRHLSVIFQKRQRHQKRAHHKEQIDHQRCIGDQLVGELLRIVDQHVWIVQGKVHEPMHVERQYHEAGDRSEI